MSNRHDVGWLQKLSYDLADCALWEFVFPSNDKSSSIAKPPRQSRDSGQQNTDDAAADDEDDVEVCLFFS